MFLALAAAIGFAGYHFYSAQRRVIELEVRRQLTEVADLKSNQVAAWRLERVGDASVAVVDAQLMPDLRQVLSSQASPATRQRVLRWMDAMRTNYQYANIVLSDGNGKIRLTSGQLLGTPEFYRELTREAALSSGVIFKDRPRDARVFMPHFSLGVGLKSDKGATFGTIMLGIDPWSSLYPTILKWPTSSRTGEAVLVRRDREQVLYLSEFRGESDSAMDERDSLAKRTSPVVRAVLGQGIADGIDNTGVAVFASARRVPGSDWIVVAKIDQEEAYAPLRDSEMLILLIGGLLILMCAAGVGLIWRHQVSTSYRQQYEAEQKRRALLGHYDYLTRYANDAILLLDQDGAIVEANERATESFGYSKEELLRLNIRDLKGPEMLAEFEQTWDTLHKQGHLVFETTNQRKDGSSFATEISSRMIEVEGSRHCQSIIRDITDRKHAEQQIRRLNRLYAVLSHCGQAIVHAQTEFDLFDEVCRIAAETGGFLLAYIGMADFETQLIKPVARAGVGASYLDVVTLRVSDGPSGQGPAGTCIRERRPVICNDFPNDPSTIQWRDAAKKYGINSSISFPLRRGGEVIGVFGLYASDSGFFNDEEATLAGEISDSISHALDTLEQDRQRRRAEYDLRVNRERLELILDASDEGYWDWNLVTGEILHSPRYDTMLGYEPGELKTGYAEYREMTHPADQAALEESFKKILESQEDSYFSEFRMRCKSGEYIWIHGRGKIVERDNNRKPVRMVGTNTDITERKKLEEQFLQAQKLESVGRLAGGIAHDFNNLLTVINGYSTLLLSRLPQRDLHRKQLEEIRAAGEQAAALTQQLLAFSRKQKIQPKHLKLNAAVADSQKLLHRLLGEDIELTTILGASPDDVMADPGQIHQVLMNLVVNARDAMPDGGSLVIETRNVDLGPQDMLADSGVTQGPFVLVQVTDTGIGMDRDTCQHIFEPFFTTKEIGKGTGLGLSTVYGIVRQSGGFLAVDSELGKGTCFKVYLPLALAQAPVQTISRTPATNLFGSETVLLVEDQETVREFVTEMLQSYGYTVVSAANGGEALVVVRLFTQPIHLLLTDVTMPGMNGKMLAQRVKALKPEIKVLYMSGHTNEAIGPAGVLNSVPAYIQKPFSPEALAAKIREVLDAPDTQRTIVVVDDEEQVRTLMQEVLASAGYNVLTAAEGRTALEFLTQNPAVDLVITDLVMPDLEGIELIREIRSNYPKVKIMAVSGAFGGQLLKPASYLGADATLAKPFRQEALLESVEKIFSQDLPPAPAAEALMEKPAETRNLLVVDDDPAVLQYLESVLTGRGFQIRTAANEAACLECVAQYPIDLVITDLVLRGGGGGLAIMRSLKRSHPDLPVILISGAAQGGFAEAAKRLGVWAILQKPVDSDTLLGLVEELRQRPRATRT